MDWNLLISIGIILIVVLVISAKVTGQTIVELLSDIKDFLTDKKDSTVEIATQVYD